MIAGFRSQVGGVRGGGARKLGFRMVGMEEEGSEEGEERGRRKIQFAGADISRVGV